MAVPDFDPRGPSVSRLITDVWAFALAVGLAYLLWRVSHVLLILFAGILGAVFLDGLARVAQRGLRLPHTATLVLAIAAIGLAIAGFALAVGPQLLEQSRQLADLLPQSIDQLRSWAQHHPWGRLLTETHPGQFIPSPADLLGQISGVFSTTLGGLATAVIIFVLALYLAINPRPYIDGFIRLLPPRRRDRGREVLHAIGRALRWWLVGRTVSMLAVGMLTAIGLWSADLPAALALGVLSGALSFVPYIGAIAAAVPALLIALPSWPWGPLWVLVIYGAVHLLEGNIITPFVQKRAVSLPPVTLLISQLMVGLLFGLLGLLLATPLAVVVIVLVQMLYIEDVLGEPVRVLGVHGRAR